MVFEKDHDGFQKTQGMAGGTVVAFAQGTADVSALEFNLQPIVPVCGVLSQCGEKAFFELDDPAGQVFQLGLVKQEGTQDEYRLAIAFVGDEHARIAGFIDIAQLHGRGPKTSAATLWAPPRDSPPFASTALVY
jgi:hypothetical protein